VSRIALKGDPIPAYAIRGFGEMGAEAQRRNELVGFESWREDLSDEEAEGRFAGSENEQGVGRDFEFG